MLQELGQWYRHHFTVKPTHGVIKHLVDGLIKTACVCAPRKQAAHQLYHERFWETKLKDLFNTNWATLGDKATATNKAGARNSFVKKLFNAEPEVVRQELRAVVEQEHNEAMVKWKAVLEIVKKSGG